MKNTILIMIALTIISCDDRTGNSSDEVLQKQTEMAMQEANRQVGMPAIVNYQEKKTMKMIYELRDQEQMICYAYLFNKMTGRIGQYLGRCVGYGLPYSTQFSNPTKTVDTWQANGFIEQLPQPEPNGLFMPEGLSATWLLLIDPNDSTATPHPVYVEPEIIVSPFKLHKDK